jgi:Flp pilus assembly protein TadD, contains TPR repeats
MKHKIHYALLAVCLFCGVLNANGQANDQGIHIKNPDFGIDGETLSVQMDIAASGLDVSCSGAHRLELSVAGNGTKILLPDVVYTSHTRDLFTRRKINLSREFQQEPYEVFVKVRPENSYQTDYAVSLPFYSWMEGGRVEYRHLQTGCDGEVVVSQGILIENISYVWNARKEIYQQMVCLLTPEVEAVKSRAAMLTLHIEYPVNVYDIRPEHGSNYRELAQVDSLMRTVLSNELVNVTALKIKGYASPDGPYDRNVVLASNRADGFKKYLNNHYNTGSVPVSVDFVAEDWDGVVKALEKNTRMPYRDDMLGIIEDTRDRDPDTREWMIKQIAGGAPRKRLLEEVYPKLRRIELTVDYVIRNVEDRDASELIFSRPEVLSLNEMFRAALTFGPEDERHDRVFHIAVEHYPDDFIANNNAAASCLRDGDVEGAYPYLQKITGEPRGYLNIGTYYYILGDVQKASEFFRKAADAGIIQGYRNIELLK